jgi:hypothetical protein
MAEMNVLGGRWVQDKPNKNSLLPDKELCSPEEMHTRIETLEERVELIMKHLSEQN